MPESATQAEREPQGDVALRPYFLFVRAQTVRSPFRLDEDEITLGRHPDASIPLAEAAISRTHAVVRRTVDGTFVVEDGGSVNGTFVNGARVSEPTPLREGDRLQVGSTILKFVLLDEVEEEHQRELYAAAGMPFDAFEAATTTVAMRSLRPPMDRWSPDSWRARPVAQGVEYPDPKALERVVTKLGRLPPLVTSWEIEELKSLIADAQEGRRFLLQGGDCAETLDECEPDRITAKLKILIQMSIVLIRGARRPVIRVGRFAGQYAKPRTNATESRGGVELPSYFGDLVNRPEFTAEARAPDPQLLLMGYLHAAVTLNFVRALSGGGFADLRRPEYFDLSFFERADLPEELSQDYRQICREITDGLHFARAFGDRSADDLMKVSFFASHEGLNLIYEAAQTRSVPRRDGYYDLTTHLPWIGERTRALDGAHVEFFRGLANPVAVKIGPSIEPDELVELCRVLNPRNEPGKLVLIGRFGAKKVKDRLPRLLAAVEGARRRVLWVSDPMHGNAILTQSGGKTRNFDDILAEVESSMEVHEAAGTYLGGLHFELTGEDVTECIGAGLTEADLARNYGTLCDPRLNYRQALQMAFKVASRLSKGNRGSLSSYPPPPPPPSARRG